MNTPNTALAERRETTPLDALKSNLSKRADEFRMVLPSHISVDKFQRVVATAALQNPQLMTCDRQSFLMAAMKLAQDGLLPDGREAALVPFKTWNKNERREIWLVQPMPMVYGLRKKILQSGQIVSLETGVVYRAELEGGNFLYEVGMTPPIRHRPKLDMTEEQATDDNIVAAYSIARIKSEGDGEPYWSVEVISRVEINKVRQASKTGAVGKTTRDNKPIPPKGPWVDWFGEMARKTVMRRHSKVLPMSGDILDAFERDITAERAAESAAAFLDAGAEVAPSLPPAEQFDAETGEIIDNDHKPEPAEQVQDNPQQAEPEQEIDTESDEGFCTSISNRARRVEFVADLNALEKEWKDRAYQIDDEAMLDSVQRDIDAARERLSPRK